MAKHTLLSIPLVTMSAACVQPIGADASSSETSGNSTETSTDTSTSTSTESESESETGEEPSGDLCPEDPKLLDYELRFDGVANTQTVDIDELCDVAQITGADLVSGLTVSFDCVGGGHTLEVRVDVDNAPAGLPFLAGESVQLRAWGSVSWTSSMNVFVRDEGGAVLLAWYKGEHLPDDVPSWLTEDYAPADVSDGLYLWLDEDFQCPVECPMDTFVPECECHEELALGIRLPGFQETIIKVESAGPVPSDPEGFAAINQAYNLTYDPICRPSHAPDSWFDLLVLGGG